MTWLKWARVAIGSSSILLQSTGVCQDGPVTGATAISIAKSEAARKGYSTKGKEMTIDPHPAHFNVSPQNHPDFAHFRPSLEGHVFWYVSFQERPKKGTVWLGGVFDAFVDSDSGKVLDSLKEK